MSRLTEKGHVYHALDFMDDGISYFVNKLREYEDVEEQGLLVKIDCRCRNCKHVDFAGCKNKTCYCLKNECYMQEDDFCKYAERYKEENKLAEKRKE